MTELSSKDKDIQLLITAGCHLGSKRVTKQMKGYVYKCKYCNCTYDNEIKFCPSCGAKIEKTTKEE